MADTPEILMYKVYVVIALSFAARGCEVKFLGFEEIRRVDNTDGTHQYFITFKRSKAIGPKEVLEALIVGNMELSIIDRYIALFPLELRIGRFFRKLILQKGTNR